MLSTGVFAAIGGSRVSANAFRGSGGQILIEARGFFLGDRSNIDASSQLGIDGVVEVNNDTIITDPNLISLSSELFTPNLLAQDCLSSNRNRFAIVDRSRTLPVLDHTLETSPNWSDDRDWRTLRPSTEPEMAVNRPEIEETAAIDTVTEPSEWSEASHWYYDDHQNIQLIDVATTATLMAGHPLPSSCTAPTLNPTSEGSEVSTNLLTSRRRSP
jgi:hypothetical protein